VILTYGPNGQSRGVATIIFVKPSSGAKALEQNGTVVDKKTLRVRNLFSDRAQHSNLD
jgi:THO complex subunit 4